MIESYESFNNALLEFTSQFNKIDKSLPIKVVSHFDCDGISAAAIITQTLKREKIKFSLSILRQITNQNLQEIALEPYKTILFLDLGSGNVDLLEEFLKDKSVFILDHHLPKKETSFIHLNPHNHNIVNDKSISASGLAYFFSKTFEI